jgi:hypothetical protein
MECVKYQINNINLIIMIIDIYSNQLFVQVVISAGQRSAGQRSAGQRSAGQRSVNYCLATTHIRDVENTCAL